MTHAKRQLANGLVAAPATIFAILISAFLPLAAIAAPADTTTAAPKPSAPMGKGEKALKRGIAAYQKNAFALAVGACSSALSSGGLGTQDTAKALYYRGLSYRRQGRAALAISDLTNALWLKDGLDGKERADALVNRAAAYKAAGIADPGAPEAREASAPASSASSPDDGITTAALTSSEPAGSAPRPSSRPARSTASQTPPAQPAQPPAASSQSSNPFGGIGNFFGNLFSGGSSQNAANAQSTDAPDPANDVTTASTGSSAVSSWSSSTQVQSGQSASSPRKQDSRPQQQRTAALASRNTSSKHKGKYKLQVGAVRSRAEAERLAKRFASEHGNQIDGRALDVQEAVFGNMGTFYRVNVGPYASAREPDKLCKAMRGSGYDCLVVTH